MRRLASQVLPVFEAKPPNAAHFPVFQIVTLR